ncbi:hypothetical protein D3C81_101240 [compost metagenome]
MLQNRYVNLNVESRLFFHNVGVMQIVTVSLGSLPRNPVSMAASGEYMEQQ